MPENSTIKKGADGAEGRNRDGGSAARNVPGTELTQGNVEVLEQLLLIHVDDLFQ
jgi:hypothetical protein